MKGLLLALIVATASIVLVTQSIAQMQDNTQTCETCPMEVGTDAKKHFKVFDENGTRHWVECAGCAMKLLKTYDTLHIETYCDWYGPDYPIIADISQNGADTTVNPSTALLLMGGGCTANRVAYNQTAADELLSNGFSEYTMMMMQQALPANTNVTTIPKKALTFAITTPEQTTPQSYLLPAVLAIVGIAVIAGALVAYKRLKR